MFRPTVKQVSPNEWELCEDFETDYNYTVPKGFTSDGASVPRIFWWFIDQEGSAFYPAFLHDYLYRNKIGTKKDADVYFYQMCISYGLSKFKSGIAYLAVRLFGKF